MPPGLFDNTPKPKTKQEPVQVPVVNNQPAPHLVPNQGEIVSKYLNNKPQSNPKPVPVAAPAVSVTSQPKPAVAPVNNLQQVVDTTLNNIATPKPVAQNNAAPAPPKSIQPKDPKEMTVAELQQIVLTKDKSSPNNTNESSSKGIVLVTLQMVAILFVVFGFVPPYIFTNSTSLMLAGIVAIIAGLFIGIWAIMSFRQKINIFPDPSDDSILIVDGPYKYVRNPMYTALLFMSSGVVMAYPTLVKMFGLVMLFVVLFIKAGYEQKLLTQRFSGYSKYASKTGRFLPKFSTIKQRL